MTIKRIKTPGEAAKATVDILNSLARPSYNKIFLAGHNQSFFCYKCRNKADVLAALYQKVQTSEQELIEAVAAVLAYKENDYIYNSL